MGLVAVTNIKHGKDGEDTFIEAGEEVKGLDKATLDSLKESGAVAEAGSVDAPVVDANDLSDEDLFAAAVNRGLVPSQPQADVSQLTDDDLVREAEARGLLGDAEEEEPKAPADKK